MDLRFDDGFIVYLNGREVARANFAEDFVAAAAAVGFVCRQPGWHRFDGRCGESRRRSARRGHVRPDGLSAGARQRDQRAGVSRREQQQHIGQQHQPPGLPRRTGAHSHAGDRHASRHVHGRADAGRRQRAWRARVSSPTRISRSIAASSTRRFSWRSHPTLPARRSATPPTAACRSPTSGTLYAGPINVSTTTMLRAIAFKDGYASTNVDTQTYIFLDDVIEQSAADVTQPYAPWGHDKDDVDSASRLQPRRRIGLGDGPRHRQRQRAGGEGRADVDSVDVARAWIGTTCSAARPCPARSPRGTQRGTAAAGHLHSWHVERALSPRWSTSIRTQRPTRSSSTSASKCRATPARCAGTRTRCRSR